MRLIEIVSVRLPEGDSPSSIEANEEARRAALKDFRACVQKACEGHSMAEIKFLQTSAAGRYNEYAFTQLTAIITTG